MPICLPQLVHVHGGLEDILPLVAHLSGDLHAGDQVVHAVQRFQKRGFAAARGADQRRDALFGNVDIDIFQRLMVCRTTGTDP